MLRSLKAFFTFVPDGWKKDVPSDCALSTTDTPGLLCYVAQISVANFTNSAVSSEFVLGTCLVESIRTSQLFCF